mgnify:CR=1 FL=1
MTFAIAREKGAVSCKLSSTRDLIPPLMQMISEHFARESSAALIDLTLVLRELLTNAIEHGNHGQVSRLVRCRVARIEGPAYQIDVEDEGIGFDHHSLNTTLPEDPQHVQDRGLTLVHALSQRVEFNNRGNHVTAYVAPSSHTAVCGVPSAEEETKQ